MKVKELREELAKLSDDADVFIMMDSGCCGDTDTLEISLVDSYEPSKSWDFKGSLNIRCNALPGYESCISAGRMGRLAKQIQDEREERKSITAQGSDLAKKPASEQDS